MLAFAIRRLLVSIPVLLVASLIVFVLTLFTGDPLPELYAAATRRSRRRPSRSRASGCTSTTPCSVQYWNWLTAWSARRLRPVGQADPRHRRRARRALRGHAAADLFAMLLALVLAVISAWSAR